MTRRIRGSAAPSGVGQAPTSSIQQGCAGITTGDTARSPSWSLNFAKARSAAVQWFDSLPPEMKKAIQDRKAVVGMDREEVVAAMGKPDHKIRERDSDGNDTEDWIYGQPPSKTVFVHFTGERVTSIQDSPNSIRLCQQEDIQSRNPSA